jgi:hypothetical protein
MRFAASICGLKYIRPYYMENGAALRQIVNLRRRETEGESALSVVDLKPNLRVWLARKGLVKDEDLQKLEDLAGSLPRGLAIFLTTLSNTTENRLDRKTMGFSTHGTSRRSMGDKARSRRITEDSVATAQALEFCYELVAKREAAFATWCGKKRLGKDHDITAYSEIEQPDNGQDITAYTETERLGNSQGIATIYIRPLSLAIATSDIIQYISAIGVVSAGSIGTMIGLAFTETGLEVSI